MTNSNDRNPQQTPQQPARKPAAPGSNEQGTHTTRDQDNSARKVNK